MGNLILDPTDRSYFGCYRSDGTFKRLGRMPTPKEWAERPAQPEPENRGGFGFSGSYSSAGYTRWNANQTTTAHWNARCYPKPQYSGFIAMKKKVAGYWVNVEAELIMPDRQPFPEEAYNSFMSWPESKESDGMAECLKRYKRDKKRQTEDITEAVDNALKAAVRAFTEKMNRDMFNGS